MSKTKLQELKTKVEELNKQLKETYADGLREYAQEIFDKYPKLHSFAWTQYTPYFNDGEPCEFGIHADYPKVSFKGENGVTSLEELEYGVVRRDWNNELRRSENERIDDEFKEFITLEEVEPLANDLKNFTDSALYPFEAQVQALLGEGEVVITRDGIEVEDYDHD